VRILHAIHDFLPRHPAGSELYAYEICRALAAEHDVTVLCADYDPLRPHAHITWRAHGGLPVAEIVNNWVCESFEDTYRAPAITRTCEHVIEAVQPEVVHVHNLLNLSFDLPSIARAAGIPVVATLHDYTLMCASGGQRLHRADAHLCTTIDAARCARCFTESPFHGQMTFGLAAAATHAPGIARRAALTFARRLPGAAQMILAAATKATAAPVTVDDIEQRLTAARAACESVDLFIAPSRSIADAFVGFGVPRNRIRVSDYGFVPIAPVRRQQSDRLRVGFVGTLAWHKGVHILLEAIRALPADACEVKIFGDPKVFPLYADQLRRQAIGQPVRFMGAFERERTADVYASIDVLVVPSLWLENSPLVIHEAFMNGVPVIAARIGGMPDLVADGVNGLLYNPASATELAVRLRELIDDRRKLDALRHAFPTIKTIQDDVSDLERVYEEVRQRPVVAPVPA
jgi:glycosyltransferase involved in cell wall biosynthesis